MTNRNTKTMFDYELINELQRLKIFFVYEIVSYFGRYYYYYYYYYYELLNFKIRYYNTNC